MIKSKKEMLDSIADKEDKMLLSSVYDKLEHSHNNNYSQYSDFLDARQQTLVKKLFSFYTLVFYGGMQGAERQIVTVESAYAVPPVSTIEISEIDQTKVTHRDVLGALMGLGIKRQKVGDIIVDHKIYILIKEEITKYVLQNLIKIKHYTVSPHLITEVNLTKTDTFEEVFFTVPSLRIDAIVAGLLHLSRERAKTLIMAGRVHLNHFEILDNKKQIAIEDVLSVKGFGRFILSEINGLTRKDRLKILIKKYK